MTVFTNISMTGSLLSVCLPSFCLSVCLSDFLYVCLSVWLAVCLSVYLSSPIFRPDSVQNARIKHNIEDILAQFTWCSLFVLAVSVSNSDATHKFASPIQSPHINLRHFRFAGEFQWMFCFTFPLHVLGDIRSDDGGVWGAGNVWLQLGWQSMTAVAYLFLWWIRAARNLPYLHVVCL